jgi:hypothetical protein
MVGTLLPDEFSARLSDWALRNAPSTVRLVEDRPHKSEEVDDYDVIYTARFEPHSLEQAQVEIWLTDDGFIGVGFDTKERIAKRLSTRTFRHGFAEGFEPCERDPTRLFAFLDHISHGRFCIVAQVWPVVGLGKTWAAMSPSVADAGAWDQMIGPGGWIKAPPVALFGTRHLLAYLPWS